MYMYHCQYSSFQLSVKTRNCQSKDAGQSQNYIMCDTIQSTNQNSKEIHVAHVKDGKLVQVNIDYD